MIKKIPSIQNFGSFTDFAWDKVVHDGSNHVVEFSKLNILYGRNYSGKTTISRVIDTLDKRCVPDFYPTGKYQISHTECGTICESDLNSINVKTKVYNTDFIKNNLSLLHDTNGKILPFAIVGDKNVEYERIIAELSKEVGDEHSGQTKDLIDIRRKHKENIDKYEKSESELQALLKNKAKEIKYNTRVFNKPNYNITSINNDISVLRNKNYTLTEDERIRCIKLTNETKRQNANPIKLKTPNYDTLLIEAQSLLNETVTPSNSIRELLENHDLQEWVRDGAKLHRNTLSICAFCGNTLPKDLWDRIDSHFNRKSEELRMHLEAASKQIKNEIALFTTKISIPALSIYSQFSDKIDTQQTQFNRISERYIKSLTHLNSAIDKRIRDIFNTIKYTSQFDECDQLVQIQKDINQTIEENNEITTKLESEQAKAQQLLRLDAVQAFLNAINYVNKINTISTLRAASVSLETHVKRISKSIEDRNLAISNLQKELSDERKGAVKVNRYLNHYFGHKALELCPEEGSEGSKFILQRDGEPASNLSEGECSLVAFCYFMAKLHEVGSEAKSSIIWIDDPISSLDNNHIFFIFSLIEAELAKPKNYCQLFISTHSLDFLKYLKTMTRPYKKINGKKDYMVRHFIIENDNRCSRIRPMPDYLIKFTTEFNYLFDIIYNCSTRSELSNESYDYYYNFGNNLRKFLESYLFYKYPNQSSFQEKINQFFDPDHESVVLINRIVNEYSHLSESVDRSTKPIDVPEMKTAASYLLYVIKNNDETQYNALLNSIGVSV